MDADHPDARNATAAKTVSDADGAAAGRSMPKCRNQARESLTVPKFSTNDAVKY
jgi:hypothetical protein